MLLTDNQGLSCAKIFSYYMLYLPLGRVEIGAIVH